MDNSHNGRISAYLLARTGADVEEEQAVRWNIKVSKETDLALRTLLGSQGMKKGDLSKFIEGAVRWRVLQLTVQDNWERTPEAEPDEVQRL
ncbi:MAG: ribbon-helix-helix domain-containing protein, partial [Chloroflexota bacterium]